MNKGRDRGRVKCSCLAFCLKERNLIPSDFTSRSYCNYGTSRSDVGPGLDVMTQSFRGSEEEILLGLDIKNNGKKKNYSAIPCTEKA